jgi:hypothetical protein
VTVEVEKPVVQRPVMHVQQRSSPPAPIREPEIVYAPPIVVRQEQPSRTYRGDWTEVDELRRQVSREELHSTADQIYHSISKVSIGKPCILSASSRFRVSKSFAIGFRWGLNSCVSAGVAHGDYTTQGEYTLSPQTVSSAESGVSL